MVNDNNYEASTMYAMGETKIPVQQDVNSRPYANPAAIVIGKGTPIFIKHDEPALGFGVKLSVNYSLADGCGHVFPEVREHDSNVSLEKRTNITKDHAAIEIGHK